MKLQLTCYSSFSCIKVKFKFKMTSVLKVIILLSIATLVSSGSYRLALPNGMSASLKLPNIAPSSYLPKPLPFKFILPHKIAKDIFPNYAIRIATLGKPHSPVFRYGSTDYTNAQRLGVLPDSYPRDEPGALQLETFHPFFQNNYRYTKLHYPGAFA